MLTLGPLVGLPLRLAVLAACVDLTSDVSAAQVLHGTLTGSVFDVSSAAVPNAKVEAVNTGTGVARQTTVADRGAIQFNDLQAGSYRVTISSSTFSTVVQEGVVIVANASRRMDARLQVGQVNGSVTISASSVTLQTDRANVNNQITKAQVMNLPFSGNQGRKFQNFYKSLPGFSPPAELHSDAGNPQRSLGTSVNGAS